MLRVGLTGGIGSGKSTVADMFSQLGIAIIDADVIAHQLTQAGGPALKQIADTFGAEYLDAKAELNRKKLASLVFNDSKARQQLEHIIHPQVRSVMSQALSEQTSAYVILVIPLLLETGFTDLTDRILVIDTPESSQIDRVIQRDKRSQVQVEAIMSQQIDRDSRLAQADDILENTSTLAALKKAVTALHSKYLQLAAQN